MPKSPIDVEADRLIKLYARAEAEIQARLKLALAQEDIDHLREIERQISGLRADLLQGGSDWTKEVIPKLFNLAGDATGLPENLALRLVSRDILQILADNTYQALADVDRVIGRTVDDVFREVSLHDLLGQLSGYDTWQGASERIAADLSKRGVTGFVDRTGRKWSLSSYSEMVARTTSREAFNEGTRSRLLSNGQDLARISTGSSEKSCDACRAWVGRVVSLTGATPGYPTLDEARAAGMFHPNCTHSLSSALTFEELLKGGGA